MTIDCEKHEHIKECLTRRLQDCSGGGCANEGLIDDLRAILRDTMTIPATTPADGELLPCPFCQGTHVKPIEEDGRWAVFCFYCAISGPHEVFRSDAILSWNARRAQTTPPKRATPSPGKAPEPVARVVSAYGDPEAFGERAVEVMADLQKLPYDTLLYASPGKAEAERDVEKMAIAYHKQWNEEWTAVGMVDAVRPWDSLAEHTREATIRCMQAAIQQAREIHASDCAVHNEPAYPAGPCDCGALQQERDKQ